MKFLGGLFILTLLFVSCVPVKKYEELLEKEKLCSEELAKYKNDALNFEADATDLRSKHDLLTKQVSQLKTDTTELGGDYRTLLAKYDKLAKINEALETTYGKLRLTGAQESASLHADLTAKQLELQRKEDKLL